MKEFKLKVIICSVRDNRQGIAVAHWFADKVKDHPGFDMEVLDLKEINLPMLDEPNHPKLQQYQYDHTKEWSAKISEADAFVFVIPEYNYGCPPALINAVDYLFHEWGYKPAALVSYGGISAGLRSAQMAKLVLTTVKLVTLTEAISIPFFANKINEEGVFVADELTNRSYDIMMNELMMWTKGLKHMRQNILPQKS